MKRGKCPLLAVDIGNSTAGLGFFPDRTDPEGLLVRKISLSAAANSAWLRKEIERLLSKTLATGAGAPGAQIGAVISSVVPSFNGNLRSVIKEFCSKPLLADYVSSGLKFSIPEPWKTGTDRLVNAAAGFSVTGKPTAVIDFGTATTVSVVGERKTFIGGTIMPGLDMMAEALASGTEKLPVVRLVPPEEALGSDTHSAIKSGIVIGTAGAVLKIVSSIEEETGLELSLIVTGGKAGIVSPFLERSHMAVPNLIFEGLRIIYNEARDRH